MNTKIIIAATVAALSLATTAFAGEGEGRNQPFPVTSRFVAAAPRVATGSQQYPVSGPWTATFDNTALPEANGQNSGVQTANALPRGAEYGTVAYAHAETVNRWFAEQAAHRFALQQAGFNGRRS